MTLSINTNLASLNAQRNQATSQSDLGTAIARLSSGLRITSAKDDAAGLAIADRFTSQIRGTAQAGRNANDGVSLAQTAEGALASIDDNLQRMRELAVQSANATNSTSDRASLQLEVAQLQSEIDRVATQTQFNGINLLDGSFAGQAFQVGANAGQTVAVPTLASARSGALGTYRGIAFALAPGLGAGIVQQVGIALSGGPTIALGTLVGDSRAIANAINSAQISGVSATASATTAAGVTSAANASASGTATLTVNGVQIALAGTQGTGALAGNRSVAVAAINQQSAATGVVATDTGASINLVAADGRNIALAYSAGGFTASTTADFGISAAAISASNFSVEYEPAAGAANNLTLTFQDVPFTTGSAVSIVGGTVGTALSALDISTAAGANIALKSIDRALRDIGAERASLGAAQNRFSSTIGNLQTAGDSLTASRSRIQDADFAAETANLSRAQVLQQAGTAMIAQANQLPGQVLALLRTG